MAEIIAEHLRKTFRGRRETQALEDVSFEVAQGELLVLLGPSGCGKTTTLRCLAGLENPDEGRIRFGERVIVDRDKQIRVPAHRRPIGLVFQSFALWPHMSARRNIEYPLRAARMAKAARAAAVDEVAKTVDLEEVLLDKRPGQLSGGQQQRVSLARALVREAEVVLFDEPLSNLDAQLREQLRSEIGTLHRRLGFTGVYVTHDLTEAVALGDQIAVMHSGKIVQLGSPVDVFEQPVDIRTARLVGLRPFVTIRPDGAAEGVVTGNLPARASGTITVLVRPDRLRPSTSATGGGGTVRLDDVRITDLAYVGGSVEVVVEHAIGMLRIIGQPAETRDQFAVGDRIAVEAELSDVRCYGDDGRLRAADPSSGSAALVEAGTAT